MVCKFLLLWSRDGEEVGDKVTRGERDDQDGLDSLAERKTGRSGDQRKVHDRFGAQKKRKKELFRFGDRRRVLSRWLMAGALPCVYQGLDERWKKSTRNWEG